MAGESSDLTRDEERRRLQRHDRRVGMLVLWAGPAIAFVLLLAKLW
ncbi:MAG: hypothetical protein WB767_10560 [Nocardioides sp.]